MAIPLRVLIVEDMEDDALLMLAELKRGGYDPVSVRVDTSEAMSAALRDQQWDLVLSDYSMPRFNGLEALKLFVGAGIDIPFIMISGAIGENDAIEATRAGAHDYIMKGNMLRLIPTINRELKEAEIRRDKAAAEKALGDSEEKFTTAFQIAPYAITITREEDGKFIEVNDAFTPVTGYTRKEALASSSIGLKLWVNEEDRQTTLATLRTGKPVVDKEYQFRTKSGMIITGLYSAQTTKLNNTPCILSSICDITERKQAEAALRASEEKFRLLAEFTNDWEYWHDNDGQFLYVAPAVEQITGYKPEEFLADKTLLDRIIYPEDQATNADRIAKALAEDAPLRMEFRIRHRDGHEVWIGHSCLVIYGPDGKSRGRRASNRDITDRKQAEEALRESESRVRNRLQNILSPIDDISSLDLEDIIDVPAIQHLMDEFYALTRVPNAIIDLNGKVLVGTGWQDICTKFHRLHPETLRNCIECDTVLNKDMEPGAFKTYLCKNNLWDCVTPLIVSGHHIGNLFTGQFFFEGEKPDDSVFLAQAETYGFDRQEYMAALRRVPVWNRETINVAFDFYVTLANLITSLSHSNIELARALEEQKRAEESLRDDKQRLASIIDGTKSGTWEWNVQTGEAIFNEQWAAIIGYTLDELSPISIDTWTSHAHPNDLRQSSILLDRHFRRESEQYECESRMKHKNGHWIWVIDRGKVASWTEDGEPLWMFGTHQDITERKQIEQDKRQFYRETIKSVTQGKLDLVSFDEVSEYLDSAELIVSVASAADAATARHEITKFCASRGFSGERLALYESAVGEAVANSIKHAREGYVYASVHGDFVCVAISDKGPGISTLTLPEATLRRGFSTKVSMGMGYTIMMEATDEIKLCTGSKGTTVVLSVNTTTVNSSLSLDDFQDTWDEIDTSGCGQPNQSI